MPRELPGNGEISDIHEVRQVKAVAAMPRAAASTRQVKVAAATARAAASTGPESPKNNTDVVAAASLSP